MRDDRRPSLWKSLKRALGGAPIESPEQAPASVSPPETAANAPQPPAAQVLPGVNDIPPFLAEEPPRPAEAAHSTPPESGIASPQPARLARGLASFSRRNPDREKKFAHLLHDPPADEKGPTPPGRRR